MAKKGKPDAAPRGTRFLTFNCHKGLDLLSTDSIRDAFADQLEVVHAKGAFKLYAWVAMPSRVHLILTPFAPKWTAPKVVQAIKQPFAQKILQRWRDAGDPTLNDLTVGAGTSHFWEHGREEERRIATLDELRKLIDTIHETPVREGFVGQPHRWRWSSAGRYDGRHDSPVTIDVLDRLAA